MDIINSFTFNIRKSFRDCRQNNIFIVEIVSKCKVKRCVVRNK
jgi:hypothetical protein